MGREGCMPVTGLIMSQAELCRETLISGRGTGHNWSQASGTKAMTRGYGRSLEGVSTQA